MVPTITPITDIAEMILITLCDFLETKYRFAINQGKFTYLNDWVLIKLI